MNVPSVVLDTNLFVAAFWNKRSASAEILRACLEARVHLYYSRQIEKEIFLILRNIRASEEYKQEVRDILAHGTEITVTNRLSVVHDDPEDNKFLECAQTARAQYLITNDDHLLRVRQFEGTVVIKPSDFRRILSV